MINVYKHNPVLNNELTQLGRDFGFDDKTTEDLIKSQYQCVREIMSRADITEISTVQHIGLPYFGKFCLIGKGRTFNKILRVALERKEGK